MQETQEMQVQSLGREDPLEEGMATHSSILAWRIPRTEEPGGLQSIGLQRVGHNWSGLACSTSSQPLIIIVIYKDVGDTVIILVIYGGTTELRTL